MLQKILFVLCLVPTLAMAQSVCLEGPSGGQCHNADMNGEVFRPARAASSYTPPASSRPGTVSTNTKQVANNNRRTYRINNAAEQRIRQRAQIIEARAQSRRNLSNQNY